MYICVSNFFYLRKFLDIAMKRQSSYWINKKEDLVFFTEIAKTLMREKSTSQSIASSKDIIP